MKRVVAAVEYVIELTDEESGLVLDTWYDGGLGERLDKLPIRDIDYDGHFGANIFYTVNADDESEELHEQVLEICRQRLTELDGTKLRKDMQ